MATIANQIKRIADSRDILRVKGRALGLQVPAGQYWDDTSNTYKSYSATALAETDQIDKIAAAFNTVNLYRDQNGKNEFRVPISVRTDGENIVVETTTLPTGFYDNTVIVPYVKIEQVEDIVINVEMVSGRELTAQTGTINPSAGFNYIGQFGYKIVDGAIDTTNAGYGNNYVTAKVKTSGWLDAGDTVNITVDESKMTSKVGSGSATSIASGDVIAPDANNDTTITITTGIYQGPRTIVVKSAATQATDADAQAEHILKDKIAYSNVDGVFKKVTGSMPNYGGTSGTEKYTAAASFNEVSGKLAIQPALGFYNDYSSITTNIVYNPTRVFNTTSVSGATAETMAAQVYYETIPAGYYATAITRKITVQDAVGSMSIDYTGHKAKLTISKAGWVDQGDIVDVAISAGEARFELVKADLEANTVELAPARDQDGAITSYLTKVTVDNTVIFDLLSAI